MCWTAIATHFEREIALNASRLSGPSNGRMTRRRTHVICCAYDLEHAVSTRQLHAAGDKFCWVVESLGLC